MKTVQTQLRKPCVVGNWKMNGSKAENQALVAALIQGLGPETGQGIDIFLSPPALYLEQVAQLIAGTPIKLAAQNCYFEAKGAYTGEISGSMLIDLGCSAVILGHSERRQLFLESQDLVARKFLAAYHVGLIPILCLGETLAEREAGKTLDIIREQLMAVLALAGIQAFTRAMIAYEPVWAIGTGIAARPEDAEEAQAFIRSLLADQDSGIAQKIRILYGGSVKATLAQDLFAQPDIDGGLIGGASLIAQEFLSICKAAELKRS